MEGDIASPSQVSAMAGALISSAADKDKNVQDTVITALTKLGRHQHAVVLGALRNYIVNTQKLDLNHRVILLRAMNSILKEVLANTEINITLARELIGMASEDMTKSKKPQPEWQSAASDVVVTLGTVFVNEVMEDLLKKLPAGILPHFFVVQTLGNLAVANAFKMVPYLNHLLTSFMPVLGLAKHDNMRWVFAKCLGQFAEAILEYVMNIDKAPDPSITRNTFSNEIFGAYNILYSVWILTKETKLRCAVVDALGKMTMLLSLEKLEEQASKLMSMLVSLYRRQPGDPYPITKAICDVITATSDAQCRALELNLEGLVTVLHGHICSGSNDGINPAATKNYNEVLRCFSILASQYSEVLVNFMLTRVDSKDERIRIGCLVILRHLINSSSIHIEERKDVIVIGLTKILIETSNKVKQNLTRLISAMASHGFLLQEGGDKFVEFIAKQCAYQASESATGGNGQIVEKETVNDVTLQAMCDNVLYLMTTTIDGMDTVLWPFLFEFLKTEEMTSAVGVICRCLSYIAKTKRENHAKDYLINFNETVNVPSSFAIFVRLLVLLSQPRQSRCLADYLLDLLVNLGPIIHHKLTELWDSMIPEIKKFLEDAVASGMWSQRGWEEQIFQLLSSSIEAVADEEWTCLLGVELANQWSLYNQMPQHKNFSFKCMGVLLRLSTNKEFVEVSLTSLFQSIKQSELAEREGAGICLGYAASSHLDLTLSKLSSYVKNQVMKKDSSFLSGFFKSDKAIQESEWLKGTAGLCCGYAAYYAPPELVPSRVDAVIVKLLLPMFKGIKDAGVKENLVYAVELVACAVHPNHMTNHPVHQAAPPSERQMPSKDKKKQALPSRGELLSHLQAYLKEDGLERPSSVKAAVLSAITELVKLDPLLNDADLFQLIKICSEYVIKLPDIPQNREEAAWPVPQKLLQEQCNVGLHSVLREIIVKCPTPNGLDSVFKHLHNWLTSEHAHERERGLRVASQVFDVYFDAFVVTKSNTSLNTMGVLMSRVIARCCDPVPDLRKDAVECVKQLLKIQNKYNGAKAGSNDDAIETLGNLAERLQSTEPNEMYQTMRDIAKVIMTKMPNELTYFVDGSLTTALMNCLLDPHPSCANGACLTLHHIFKTRGTGFGKQVNQIVETIQTTLKSVTDGTTRVGILKLMSLLTAHHLQATLNSLLSNPLPYTEQIVACWRALGSDDNLCEPVTEYLLNLLSKGLPYDEKHKGFMKKSKEFTRTATTQLIAASCALREVLEASSNDNGKDKVVKKNSKSGSIFQRTVAVCLIRVGSMRAVGPPPKVEVNPFRQAIDSLYCLIAATCGRDISQFFVEKMMWNNFESEDEEKFYEAISTFASGLARYKTTDVADIVTFLNPFISSVYVPQRVTVTAFFSQLIAESAGNNEILLEVIVNSIRGRLVDPSGVVRRLSIRGLANVVGSSPEQVERYGTSVLSAMMSGMDDKHDLDDSIALEAMTGLERFLTEVKNTNIHSIFVNLCLRIRPCFEKDNPDVRSTAIRLFGCLTRCGTGPSENAFVEQVHNNLIAILLHLNDDDQSVRKACKVTLQKVSHVLGSKAATEMFNKFLHEDAELHYGEFMNDLSKILVRDIPDKTNVYLMGCVSFFKSHWASIRSNAAMFTGFLMSNAPEDVQHTVTREQICAALIQLLKDSSPGVRAKSAEAMSVLHQY
ncbi:maestro heat-like repeat-containing protein family member 1 [Styela clava]